MAYTTKLSDVHIILLRHGNSISNIDSNPETAIDQKKMNPKALGRIALALKRQDQEALKTLGITKGSQLPNGLTAHGLKGCNDFVKTVQENTNQAGIDNLYLVVYSPLKRAVQTISQIREAFALADDDDAHRLYVHPDLMEASQSIQYFPSLRTADTHGRSCGRYILAQGGHHNTGKILHEEQVDTSTFISVPSPAPGSLSIDMLRSPSTRKDAIFTHQKLDDNGNWVLDVAKVEADVLEFRRWLRAKAVDIASNHTDRRTVPKILVCLHGGIRNFVTEKWFGTFDGQGRYKTCQMGNLGANVFRFSDDDGPGANLVEVTEPETCGYYRETLGEYFVQTKDWVQPQAFKEVDGATVKDQRKAHVEWISKSIRSTIMMKWEKPKLFEALVMWTGVDDFLENYDSWEEVEDDYS